MMAHVPFYQNIDDFHCINAAMKSVLRFFQRKEYSNEYIDLMLRTKPTNWPWMPECALLLHELGLRVEYFGNINLMDYLKGDAFIKEITGENASHYLHRTDKTKLEKSVWRVDALKLFEKKELTLDEISSLIKKGYVPIFLINNIFVEPKQRLGKYVVVTGIDEGFVYYHETGPKEKIANHKVKREEFLNAWFKTKELILVLGNLDLVSMK